MKFTEEQEFAIALVKRVLLKPILNLIEGDPHQWSVRPCSTCQTISQMIEEPFGCLRKTKQLAEADSKQLTQERS